jgi:hypothetical protein
MTQAFNQVKIEYREDYSLTQPYVLLVDGEIVFQANTHAKCERHQAWKNAGK